MSRILDENGRLYGIINVVDLLVVLVVLGVVTGGVVLVVSSASSSSESGDSTATATEDTTENATRYAMLDIGRQPVEVAEEIDVGDSFTTGNHTLRVTDMYISEAGTKRHVVVRAALDGETDGEQFTYAGAPPRISRTLLLRTNDYNVSGDIRDVGADSESLDVREQAVVVDAVLPTETLEAMEVGDSYELAGQTVATVDTIDIYGSESRGTARARIGLTYTALARSTGLYVGSTRLEDGASLPFDGPTYEFGGTVQQTGDQSVDIRERDVVVTTTMQTETLDSVQVGDTYEVGGQTLATIQSVDAYGTGSPGVTRANIGVTYKTLERRTGPYVGTTFLQEGATLPFEGPGYEFAGNVERTGALEPRGERGTRTVTLELEDVNETTAETVTAGMSETVRGETVAEVTDVETEPATLVVTSQDGEVFLRDHPTKRNLQMTVELQVRETSAGPTFKGESLRQGQQVTLDLGVVTVRPAVVSL